jgi:hypothetical protein
VPSEKYSYDDIKKKLSSLNRKLGSNKNIERTPMTVETMTTEILSENHCSFYI